MDNEPAEPVIGITKPATTPDDIAVERWLCFMVCPGFGIIALIAALAMPHLDFWVRAGACYAILYVSIAYSRPGFFARFWREIGVLGPAKVREIKQKITHTRINWRVVWAKLFHALIWCVEEAVDLWAHVKDAREHTQQLASGQKVTTFTFAGLGGPAAAAPEDMPAHASAAPAASAVATPAAAPTPPAQTWITEDPDEEEKPARKPLKINWVKLGAALLNWRTWAFLAVAVLAILWLTNCAGRGNPFQPSGATVAAQARAETEGVNTKVARHEADVAVFGAQRAEQTHQTHERTRHAVATGQQDLANAIAALPPSVPPSFFVDLNARYHRGFDRVWDGGPPVGAREPDHDASWARGLLSS